MLRPILLQHSKKLYRKFINNILKKGISFKRTDAFFFRDFIYILISSVLFYFSFPNVVNINGFGFLSWFCVIPFIFAIENKSIVSRIKLGLLKGILDYLFLVNWVSNVDFLGYISFVFLLSVQVLIFSAFFFCKFESRFVSILYLSCLWVTSEFLRTFLLGGFVWTIGHSNSLNTLIIQMSDLTGPYGVSFVILFVNLSLYYLLKDERKWYKYLFYCLVLISLVISYGKFTLKNINLVKENKSQVIVSSIQPNILPKVKFDPLLIDQVMQQNINLTKEILDVNSVDLIVWPEVSITDDVLKDKKLNLALKEVIKDIGTNFLVGTALLDHGKNFNSAVFFDKNTNIRGIYSKNKLIPFAEYWPLNSNLFEQSQKFTRGDSLKKFEFKNRNSGDRIVFGVLICSESFYLDLFEKLGDKALSFIVVMLNDSWLKAKESLMMHAYSDIMNAATLKIPIIRSSNTGITAYIDACGKISKIKNLNEAAVFNFSIPIDKRRETFYSKYKDVFSLICLFYVLVCLSYQKIKNDCE